MQNIAVSGVNITSPASFEITATGGGVVVDSGTTLAYLPEPAYTQFVNAVSHIQASVGSHSSNRHSFAIDQ